MSSFVIGIDVGGTNVKLGLVSPTGKIIDRSHLSTKSFSRTKSELVLALVEKVRELLARNKLKNNNILGLGIGLPGIIDPVKGQVIFLPNISGWKNVPLKKMLEKRLGIKTFLENDAKMIALAEWKFGAGRGFNHVICMTLGTGVGSGLILDGKLYRGKGFAAGELGHMPINENGPKCSCGSFGCLESYVGNAHLLAKAREMFGRSDITFEKIYPLAKKGDALALKFWKEVATHIGNGLAGPVNLLNPERIVIGGGVANNLQFMLKTIHDVIRRRAMKRHSSMVKVVRDQLRSDAGMIGAHVLVHQLISNE